MRKLIGKLKRWNEWIIQVKESDFEHQNIDRNPYQVFLDWLLEVIQFGVIYTVIYSVFIQYEGMIKSVLFVFAFGLLQWVWLNLVQDTSNAIRGKH